MAEIVKLSYPIISNFDSHYQMKEIKEMGYIKNLVLTSIIGGLVGVLNYVFNIIVARYTSPDIFGTFSAAMAIIYLLQIPIVSIQAVITKKVGEHRRYDLNRFKWNSVLIFSLIGLVISTIFFLVRIPISHIASVPTNTFIYLTSVLLVAFISPIAKGLLLGTERIVAINFLLLLEAILRIGMGVIAVKLGGSLPILILSNCIPMLITTLIILPIIKLNGEPLKNDIKVNYKELILTTVSFFLLSAPYTLDLILVNTSFRSEYSAVSLLGKLVYFAAITIASVMFARLSNETNPKAERKTLFIALLGTVGIGLIMTLGLYIFKDLVIKMTIGEQYLSVAPYIAIFGLCMTGYAIVYMLANYFISINRFSYIYILVGLTIIQISLFMTRNGNLMQVLYNQIVVYSLLTVLTLGYLFLTLRKREHGQKTIQGDR
jgi:O-antigen/teichoic acid export membrane protein